ncbi:MAG: 2-oxo acid dehydrogenase subunit E2 [Deltaproteobacteria bacterium]|nr:2-oxo acid dehydrogenase subunit E2 [Deltaproteobacteria bacterium]
MVTKILLPQGGQDLKEATVARWLKAEGDQVKEGDLICEIETEKAVFEVEAECDGTLLKIIVEGGQTAPTLSVIGYIGETGEKIELTADDNSQPETESTAQSSDSKTDSPPTLEKLVQEAPMISSSSDKLKISGRARRKATQKGFDPSLIPGSGPGGRIIEKDVLSYSGTTDQAITPMQSPSSISYPDAAGKRAPLTKMRQVIARRLQQSKQQLPHFYVTVSVEMDEALKVRSDFNRALNRDDNRKLSVNDLIIKATAHALEEFYEVNCHFRGDHLLYLDDINIGVAVSLPSGLVVPVLEHADQLPLGDIVEETKRLISLAKAGKQASVAPGSFTISNMGMLEVESFTAIINPPECGILAVSGIQKKVVVSDPGDLCIRQLMKMTLSADHRAVDGVLAANFSNKIKYQLQNPRTLLK